MLTATNLVARILVQAGGWAMLLSAGLVTFDVITRKLFNFSIAGADEISGYVFAASTSGAFAYAVLSRANIRIDFIYQMLPAPVRRVLDIVSLCALTGLFGFIVWYALPIVSDSITFGSRSVTPLQTPLMIPQGIWLFGLCFCLFASMAVLVTAVMRTVRGDFDGAQELVGIPSLDQEIAQETGNLPESADKKEAA